MGPVIPIARGHRTSRGPGAGQQSDTKTSTKGEFQMVLVFICPFGSTISASQTLDCVWLTYVEFLFFYRFVCIEIILLHLLYATLI